MADTAIARPCYRIDRQHGRGLRQAIPFNERDASRLKKLADGLGKGRPPRDGKTQLAAQLFVELRKDQLVGQGILRLQE